MIKLLQAEHISLAEISAAASFSLESGAMSIVLTPKDEINLYLTKLLIGLEAPRSGKIVLFNTDAASISNNELREIRRRIGVVYGSGGLISNLKVWENLILPLNYHQQLNPAEVEARGLALLSRLGYTGRLMALPGHLTISQKKLVGFARAMLITPDVMLYESPDSGLNQEEKDTFFRIATEFHREKPERASLFITSNQEVVRFLPEASVINLTNGPKGQIP